MSDYLWYKRCWEVPGITRADQFFAALPDLLSFPVYLCFEGTSMAPDIRALFESRAVEPARQIPKGTLWPKPSIFHVIASTDFVQEMARLALSHAEPEICDHFHAYNSSALLVQWHDAFVIPLLVDDSVPQPSLEKFCERLGVSFHRPRK